MTDSLPTPDDRAPDRRDETPTPWRHPDDQDHEEQPGFPDGPISPAEGGD